MQNNYLLGIITNLLGWRLLFTTVIRMEVDRYTLHARGLTRRNILGSFYDGNDHFKFLRLYPYRILYCESSDMFF